MNILDAHAEQEFVKIVSSISKTPMSWGGWYALHIKFHDIDEGDVPDCLIWSKSILSSYLKDVEGRAFFCHGQYINVLCKNVPFDVLEQTGRQICDLIFHESEIVSEYHVYDLGRYGQEFYMKSGMCDERDMHVYTDYPVSSPMHHIHEERFHDEEKKSVDLQDCALTRVLLVEDDPVTRWMVRNTLKQECEFATATCANKAYNAYASFQPDLVFLDINLPDQNGTSVLKWIIHHDPGASVVMFSSNNHLDMITETLNAGACGFVAKPFLRKDLLHYVYNA